MLVDLNKKMWNIDIVLSSFELGFFFRAGDRTSYEVPAHRGREEMCGTELALMTIHI